MTAEIAGVATTAPADSPAVRAAIARAKLAWESTVDALPDLICLLDADGRIVRINRVVERWTCARSRTRSRATCTAFCTSAAPRRAASC